MMPPEDDEPTDDEFFDAMSGDREALAFVLRGALYVEHALLRFIESKVAHPASLEKARLGYAQMVALAAALGLDARLAPALRRMGKIRNDFAHQPGVELAENDVAKFLGCFDPAARASFPVIWERLEAAAGRKFSTVSSIEQFCFLVVCLRAMVTAERTLPRAT